MYPSVHRAQYGNGAASSSEDNEDGESDDWHFFGQLAGADEKARLDELQTFADENEQFADDDEFYGALMSASGPYMTGMLPK